MTEIKINTDLSKFTLNDVKNLCSKKSKNDIKKYTFIEVCAGGGGLSSGLIKAGFI
jgi:hypothetical protein